MRYTMRQATDDVYTIHSGRSKVGFVHKIMSGPNEGMYAGRIAKHSVIEKTPRDAFNSVAARAFGFESLSELKQHNRSVRRAQTDRKRAMDRAMKETLNGNFDSVLDLLGKMR